jgi:cell division ATPase FtsA
MEYNNNMSFFSFLKSNKESYSLVFDIGSGSVSGGLVRFTEKPGVDVIYYTKELIPFQQEVSIPKHLRLMKGSLANLASRINSEGLKIINKKRDKKITISDVFYIFSSPWSVSQTQTVRIKENKAFKITEDYLSNLLEEQEKQFQINIAKAGKIIEKKIIQLKVNGYAVSEFYGKMARELEVSLFFTSVPEDILQLVGEAVGKTFNIKNSWCHSLSLSVLSVIKNLFPQRDDFIYMDINEEITDISIVRDNIMTNGVSIPLGRNHFVRELSQVLKVSVEIADSMVKMHCLKNRDELASLNLAVAMDTAARNWLDRIFKALNSLEDKVYAPEAIFLVANNDLACFIKDKLQKHDFEVLLLENKKIKSSIISENTIFKIELMFLDNLYKI